MADAVRDLAELADLLDLDTQLLQRGWRAAEQFPLFVPKEYLGKLKPADPSDPLLRQVLPLQDELSAKPGFIRDPLDEQHAEVVPGLLKKYANRALLITTSACAVHCRYCFRRHYPYDTAPKKHRGVAAGIRLHSPDDRD